MTDTNAMREAVEAAFAEDLITQAARLGMSSRGFEGTPCQWICDVRKAAILALLATGRAAGVGEANKYEDMSTDERAEAMADDCVGDPWELIGYFREKLRQSREEATHANDAAIRLAKRAAASPPSPADASDFSPHRWTEIVSNGLGANNAGCWRCGALSEVLARVLSLSGHDAKVIQGKANGEDHVWVQIGDTVYDPTVGQFQEPVSYQMDQVAPADASGARTVTNQSRKDKIDALVQDALNHGLSNGVAELSWFVREHFDRLDDADLDQVMIDAGIELDAEGAP